MSELEQSHNLIFTYPFHSSPLLSGHDWSLRGPDSAKKRCLRSWILQELDFGGGQSKKDYP